MKKILLLSLYVINIHSLSAQNVGVGTNTPVVPLHINRNTDELLRLQGTNPYMQLFNSGGAIGYMQAFGQDLLVGTNFGNPSGSIRFYNNNVINMTILPNGNVGIGATTPTSPLSFPNLLGNKISLWNTDANHDFGIGIAPGAMQLYTAGQDRISFGWGNANSFNETMTFFTGSGQVGLGTTNPAVKLHINQNGEALRLSGASPYLGLYNGGDFKGFVAIDGTDDIEVGTAFANTNGNFHISIRGTPNLSVYNNGNVQMIGSLTTAGLTTSGSVQSGSLVTTGNISAGTNITLNSQLIINNPAINIDWMLRTHSSSNLEFFKDGVFKAHVDNDGDWVSASDIRLKEMFESNKSVLDGIKKLDVLTYHYKADKTGKRSFGLVAQNVQQYFPEIVSSGGKDDFMGIAYAKTGVLAIKAIQEQQQIIEALEKRIAALESERKKLP